MTDGARTTSVLIDGLKFPEGPRWHDGKLWFSDMHDLRVFTVDLSGTVEVVAEVPAQPSGLGFTPDGELLIVSMLESPWRPSTSMITPWASFSGVGYCVI